MRLQTATVILCVASAVSMAWGGDVPPASAKPLSEILRGLNSKYVSITDAAFDDGEWEIEALHDQKPVELRVDPSSGAVIEERADGSHDTLPAGALPMVDIVRRLEDAGYGIIYEVDLNERGRVWDVETSRKGARRELTVDVQTGKVLTDRADD